MRTEFFDMEWEQNPENGRRFDNAEELLEFIEALHSRNPFFFELRGENGYMLNIGIGQLLNAVQLCLGNGDPPYLLAVAPGSPERLPGGDRNPYSAAAKADDKAGVKAPEFLCGGTATPVPTRYCVTNDVMKQIAAYFLETGKRSPDVFWEEI